MICKKCGNQIKEGAKFCNNCGYDLSNEPFDTDVSDENVQSITLKKEDEKEKRIHLAFSGDGSITFIRYRRIR